MSNQITLEEAGAHLADARGPVGLPIASTNPAKATAATYLGVSRRTIYRLIDAGELDTFRVGSRLVVARASLDAFIGRQRGLEADR